MNIKFVIDGVVADPERYGSGPGGRVLRGMKADLERKLKGVIDPRTGKPPDITVVGKSVSDVTIGSSGGPSVVAEVKKRLGVR